MGKKFWIIILIPLTAIGQDSLISLRLATIECKTYEHRRVINVQFRDALKAHLMQSKKDESLLDSIPYTAILASPDKNFRLYNWNLPDDNGGHQYFCFVWYLSKQTKKPIVYELQDQSATMVRPELKAVNEKQWFGALYYKILANKKSRTTYYTLLGWDGNTKKSNKKVIDVLYFSGDKPRLGASIFNTNGRPKKRIIFEYADQASMSLRYEEKRKQIVFDHLSPAQPEQEGAFEYYGPDFTYDAFQWKKGKWQLIEDINIKGDIDLPFNPKIESKEKPIYEKK